MEEIESVGEVVFTYSGSRDFFPTEELNKFVVEGYNIQAKETAGGKCIDIMIFKKKLENKE